MKSQILNRITVIAAMAFVSVFAYAQSTVTGTIIDAANDEPIIGASVLVMGTTSGTITDFDGNFTVSVPDDDAVLQISYMGYKTQEVPVNGQKTIRVVLHEDSELLDEVVVVGYGVVKKNDATGAVTAIKPDDMNKGLQTNAQDMIQGKIAGVSVTSDGGAPGGGANIRIRGGSSLSASNNPLIIIDGLAMDNNGIPGAGNPLAMVNPSDIETFTVLKDASATAIYGSRASNGVIIITTKKGSAGSKPKVNYEGNMSVGTLTHRLETLTGDELRAYATVLGHGADKTHFLGTENTNWQDQIYRTAISTDHNISLTGGTKNMPYRASIGYTLNNGTIKTSQMQRVTGAISLNPTFLDKHLTFNINAKGMYIYNFYNASVVGAALSMDPTMPVYGGAKSVDGSELVSNDVINQFFGGYYQPVRPANYNDDTWQYAPNSQSTHNPLASLMQQKNYANSGVFIGNIEADYKIHGFEDLHLHANFGADYSYGKQRTDNSPYGTANHYYGWKGFEEKHKYNLLFTAYAQYIKEFNENHYFDVMAAYEYQYFYNDYYSDGWGIVPETNNDEKARGSKYGALNPRLAPTHNALVSFFGRANYHAFNRYLFTVTVRADGSSRFAHDLHWGVFPSGSFAWKIKEEHFMQDVNWINDLKLRLGYGITGQQELGQGDFPYLATYTKSTEHAYYPVGGESNMELDEFGNPLTDADGNIMYYSFRANGFNPYLVWERTTTYNAGIDFGFLNNRVSGSIDYYFRQTDNLLNVIPVAVGTNFRNKVISNVGTLTNQGVEFALNAVAIDKNNFKWDLGFNFTYNQNKIVKLNTGDEQTPIPTGGISSGTGNTIQRHAVGYPASSFYVYQTAKGQRANGESYYYIVDRNSDGAITEEDQYYYHSPSAPISMGFQTKFQFYGFDLGISLRSNIGNYVYNDVLASGLQWIEPDKIYQNQQGGYHGVLRNAFNTYWVNGMKSDAIYTDEAGTSKFSEWFRADYFVENASFLRIDNITLGYSFAKSKISGRAYVTVQNPFVITGYSGLDPEVWGGIDNNIYPRSMTTVMGLSLQF